MWQWEQENKIHFFPWWSWNLGSSVGQVHILKDEGHSAWNVHLGQHKHVSTIERNIECYIIKLRGMMFLQMLKVRVTHTMLQALRSLNATFPSFWHHSAAHLKQSPREGSIRCTKPNSPEGYTSKWNSLQFQHHEVVKEGYPTGHKVSLFR